MPQIPGTKFGPYEILEPIGKGGMGEVYRARDSRVGRDVAVKTSAEQFSERFEREARAIAALNHPNICHLYDVGPNYLVMEYVEGESPKGPLPLDEVIKIARQIADALEEAHGKGIVHRDLKPANIKITPQGVVKVLDFGLAKVAQEKAGDPENSPTLSLAATQAGMILGTAAYMAPEQARGKPVDKRADIWAFGVVVYELLTGEPLFDGEDIVGTLAAVVHKEPDLGKVPVELRRLLKKCLEKDPKKRLRDIGDLWELLDAPATPVTASPASRSRLSLIVAIAAGALAVALAFVSYVHFREQPPAHPLMRLSVDLGPDAVAGTRLTAVLSPDGTRIVFPVQQATGIRQLATRLLDQPNATTLSGTEQGADPFFSPDGQWVGFFEGTKLKKVAAQGGAAITLCDAPGARGGSWGEDGAIVFALPTIGLMRVPEAGGTPQALTKVADTGDRVHFQPQILPGGAILFGKGAATIGSAEDAEIAILPPKSHQIKTLLHGGYFARYLPTSPETGHIVYIHEGTLFGVAFDPQRLELHGTPAPLLEDIAAGPGNVAGQYAFSGTGTLVYLGGKAAVTATSPIMWLDSAGKAAPLVAQPGVYDSPRFSPDGKRLAYIATGPKGPDVWVYDLASGTSTQLTFTAPGDLEVAWAPDGKHLTFGSTNGIHALWWIRADGAGQPQKLWEDKLAMRPTSISRDGRLIFSENSNSGLPDLYTLPLDLTDPDHPKPGKVETFLNGPEVEVDAAYSPDGHWVAYSSNEGGPEDIYVRPSHPAEGGKRKISTTGGKFPAWSHDGRLFFLGGDDRIMVTAYTVAGDAFAFAAPHAWSDKQVQRRSTRQNFDLAPDGKRVAIFPRPEVEDARGTLHATFLLNYFDEVKRRIKP